MDDFVTRYRVNCMPSLLVDILLAVTIPRRVYTKLAVSRDYNTFAFKYFTPTTCAGLPQLLRHAHPARSVALASVCQVTDISSKSGRLSFAGPTARRSLGDPHLEYIFALITRTRKTE